MMGARIQRGTPLEPGPPEALFGVVDSPSGPVDHAVSNDGQRFRVPKPRSSTRAAPITVVVNWWAESAER